MQKLVDKRTEQWTGWQNRAYECRMTVGNDAWTDGWTEGQTEGCVDIKHLNMRHFVMGWRNWEINGRQGNTASITDRRIVDMHG